MVMRKIKWRNTLIYYFLVITLAYGGFYLPYPFCLIIAGISGALFTIPFSVYRNKK
jgi:hypothetical protein